MLIVQLSSVAPGYARLFSDEKPTALHCSGDHAKCGCSPERIASKTCCCYLNHKVKSENFSSAELSEKNHSSHKSCCSKHEPPPVKKSCCDKTEAPQVKKSCCSKNISAEDVQESEESLVPSLSSIPCGSDPHAVVTAIDAIKYLPHCQSLLLLGGDNQPEYLQFRVSYLSLAVPPPDPPPKLS